MKKLILLVGLLSCGWLGHAQDFIDNALLFSRTRPGGSARIQGLGGAQVALGGDFSSALSNPAGLGMYNKSEFTISPGLSFINASTDYFGTNTKAEKTNFNIPGLSLVFRKESGRESGFLGGSFGISLTRINDFQLDYEYQGRNNNNSILDYFINDAGDIDPDEMLWIGSDPGSYFYSLTGLAYNNYLIEDRQDQSGNYFYDSKLNFTSSTQQEISQRKGSQYQWSIAYGANFSDQFFLGANLGITSLRYKLGQVYTEGDFDYPDPNFEPADNFRIDETYDIRGSGINLTIGAIYRPVNFLQIGASFVTPTYYQITDSYTARMESVWNIYDVPNDPTFPEVRNVFEQFDQPLISEYSFTTPLKLNAGMAFISKMGFVTFDIERANYTKGKYSSDIADDFEFENDAIKADYRSVTNYRVGAEYRNNIFRLRAGYNFMANPFREDDGVNRAIQTISGGFGMRTKEFFADFAASFSNTEGRRIPYSVSGPDPVANQKFNTTALILTLGFTF